MFLGKFKKKTCKYCCQKQVGFQQLTVQKFILQNNQNIMLGSGIVIIGHAGERPKLYEVVVWSGVFSISSSATYSILLMCSRLFDMIW
jgi:hypothetical protein